MNPMRYEQYRHGPDSWWSWGPNILEREVGEGQAFFSPVPLCRIYALR